MKGARKAKEMMFRTLILLGDRVNTKLMAIRRGLSIKYLEVRVTLAQLSIKRGSRTTSNDLNNSMKCF